MTVLAITGIGGFIGLRMCEGAQALGWTVRGLEVVVVRPGDVYGVGSHPWLERPLMRLPAPLLTALVGIMAIAARLLGQSPPASRAGIRFLQRRHRYSTEKARNMLGYRPRISLDEGMADIARRLGKGPIHKEN